MAWVCLKSSEHCLSKLRRLNISPCIFNLVWESLGASAPPPLTTGHKSYSRSLDRQKIPVKWNTGLDYHPASSSLYWYWNFDGVWPFRVMAPKRRSKPKRNRRRRNASLSEFSPEDRVYTLTLKRCDLPDWVGSIASNCRESILSFSFYIWILLAARDFLRALVVFFSWCPLHGSDDNNNNAAILYYFRVPHRSKLCYNCRGYIIGGELWALIW